MNAWAGNYLLLAWVVISIFSTGVALCHLLTHFRGIELIGYGGGAGVVLHAFFGLGMAIAGSARFEVVALFLLCAPAALFYIFWQGIWRELLSDLSRQLRISLSLWLAFLVVCVGITQLDVRFPAQLPDGRYVFKKHTLNVKIQYMTSLPADNYIPYTVTEYLLRHISFKDERPLIPGHEVSNRTILMSLVALPFRATLGAPEGPLPLGKFNYVGQEWPDVEKLNVEVYFRQFLIVGIFLNSLLLPGLLVLFSKMQMENILPIGTVLYTTNPYFICQTVFTWPKAMAAFFILLSWNSLRRRHDAKLVALCAALAYHCHPYAIVFAATLGLWYLREWRQKIVSFRIILEFAVVFLLSILPWLIWTQLWLRIPPDLITQNFAGGGTGPALASPINFIWIRAKNSFDLLAPRFLGDYPFNAATIFNDYVTCLPGAIGPVLAGPALLQCAKLSKEPGLLWQIFVPGALILLVFSYEAVPVLHGYQVIVGTLIFLSLAWMKNAVSSRAFYGLAMAQLLCNIGLVLLQASVVGAHAL